MRLTVRAALPNFDFVLFSALSRDHLLGKQQAANMTASKTPMHATRGNINAFGSGLGLTRSPRKSTLPGQPRWPISPILAIGPHLATPWRHNTRGCGGTKLYRTSRDLVLKAYRLAAVPLPSYGPAEASIFNVFKP